MKVFILFYFIYTKVLMIYTQDTIPLGVTIYRMLQNDKQ